ncbi:EscU/YscU/HrcU family type III secretion system export apparatus switch protein [Trinickia diaoshuihuensis]|uniref:EscU/YscU/HrcU family type III secretion system export apparatus switch protein n=1 Tax=Trinickia diaoshuihuensis TaxID=2292265 RepID=UPI000E251C13|nr:EscU/YscU/HrcU family type III secretion system export apparatus switch protein [Trinickia diaoshuihuensis]
MADAEQNRSEAATPHKLKKAREQGQVAKSRDLSLSVVLIATMLYASSQAWSVWRTVFGFARALMVEAGSGALDPALLEALVGRMIHVCLVAATPFLVVVVIAAVIGNVLQVGPLFAPATLEPKFERLNPVEGFKRLFTIQSIYQALRLLVKLAFLGIAVFFAIKSLLPQFYSLGGLGAVRQAKILLDDLSSLGLKIGAVFMLLAMFDWLLARRRFAKRMRMSRREVKDEVKQREGDPRIRARLRELRRDVLKRSLAVSRTRHADVVITNPVHLAVALRYVEGEMQAPQMVAKGRGLMAAVMRSIAARHGIPIVPNAPLARALYRETEPGRHIPPAMYPTVAKIIVWVFARRRSSPVRGAAATAGTAQGSRR